MRDADAAIVEEFDLEAGGVGADYEAHGVVIKHMALLPGGGDALVVDGAAVGGFEVEAEADDAR